MDASSDDSSVLSSILNPEKGLHTTSITRLALRGSGARLCTLHLYFSLPTQLFADPYELAHRRAYYAFEHFGGGNLEAPVFAPGAGGPSGLLLDVIIPEDVDVHGDEKAIVEVDVPLHARYGVPRNGGDLMDEVALPPPEAFWSCPASGGGGEGTPCLNLFSLLLPLVGKFSLLCVLLLPTTTPIAASIATRAQVPDALRKVVELAPSLIGIDARARRTLVLIPHAGSVRAQTLHVPVGDAGDVAFVETGTVVVILLAFVYLLRSILRASRRDRTGTVCVSATKKDG
jgi:hypothetical protein